MTAVAHARLLTEAVAVIPHRGTYPLAANTIVYKATLAVLNASGQLVLPVDGDGFNAVGMHSSSTDNRTGSEYGGAAGDVDGDVEFGIIYLTLEAGAAAPLFPGTPLYVVDNATISTARYNAAGAQRGFAGVFTEVKTLSGVVQYGCFVSPACGYGSPSNRTVQDVPLGSLRLAANGGPIIAFASGSADGFSLVDSEALSLRINDASTTVFATSVPVPADIDRTQPIRVSFLASRVGTSDTTAALTVGAFFQSVGAIHSADSNAGGATTAIATNSVVNKVYVDILAADIPAAAFALTLTFVATAALDADDALIHGIQLEYSRR